MNLNDIWKINLERVSELEWVELKPKGVKPKPRHGHTMNALHCYLIVFGGQNDEGKYLNDVFIFNTSTNDWYPTFDLGSNPSSMALSRVPATTTLPPCSPMISWSSLEDAPRNRRR